MVGLLVPPPSRPVIDGGDIGVFRRAAGEFSSENYLIRLVGIEKVRYQNRQRRLQDRNIRLDDGDNLEFRVLFHKSFASLDSTIKPVIQYLELHPLRVAWVTIDAAVATFHENEGQHYGVLSPIEVSGERRPNVFYPGISYLLPGASEEQFASELVPGNVFHGFADRRSHGSKLMESNNRREYNEGLEQFTRSGADLYSKIRELFGDEIKDYHRLEKNRLPKQHKLPVFDSSRKNRSWLDDGYPSFPGQIVTYIVGTQNEVKTKIPPDAWPAIAAGYAGISTALVGAGSFIALSSMGTPEFYPISGIIFFSLGDVGYRISTKRGLIGDLRSLPGVLYSGLKRS